MTTTPTRKATGRPRKPFIDEIAVDITVRGERRVRLTRPEQAEAMRRLDAKGLSAAQVAERVGVSTRAVTRNRAARRKTAAAS